MDKTIVNVLGAGRSGTTMLDLMLGNDEKSFSLGEVHAWFRPFRKHHFAIDCNCGEADCSVWQKIKDAHESKFHATAFEALNVDYLVDSSKNLRWVIDTTIWAQENNIRVVNICIYKSAVEFIFSIWKRTRNTESISQALHEFKLYYSRLLETGLEFYTVKFNDLATEPDKILSRICLITGQHDYPARKEFWHKRSHHLFGSGGVRQQSRRGTSDIRADDIYPDEFVQLMPRISEEIERDHRLQSVLTELQRRDISREQNSLNQRTTAHKPLWYYLARLKGTWRSHFPEQSPPVF